MRLVGGVHDAKSVALRLVVRLYRLAALGQHAGVGQEAACRDLGGQPNVADEGLGACGK